MSRTPHPRQLVWFGQTDRGKIRLNNEDSFLGLQFDAQEVHLLGKIGSASLETNDLVFAVSDGMGGANAGEFASRVTVEKITRLMPRAFKQAATGLEVGFPDLLTELFDQIHRALLFLGACYEECSGMGATLSLCWFTPGRMYFGHIGDSRIYYLPPKEGGIKQISQDDTHVGWLFRKGQLNEREARNHPRRFLLQKALGAGHQFSDPQVGAINYESGDRFLLCTDGLTEGLYDYQLCELIRTPGIADSALNPAQLLVKTAVENSGRDNTTALIIQVA
jgi:serine/threonine protein phosphatase PrpC